MHSVDVDHQIRIAIADVAVHLLDSTALAFLLEHVADGLVCQAAELLVVGAEELHFDGLVGSRQVVKLVLHHLDQFNFELMFGEVILDLVFNLFHDFAHWPAAVFGLHVLFAFPLQFRLDLAELGPDRLGTPAMIELSERIFVLTENDLNIPATGLGGEQPQLGARAAHVSFHVRVFR